VAWVSPASMALCGKTEAKLARVPRIYGLVRKDARHSQGFA
jgi:hypothetical protein